MSIGYENYQKLYFLTSIHHADTDFFVGVAGVGVS